MAHLHRLRISGEREWDDGSELPPMPEDFDMERFNRGKKFFQDNAFSCTLAMFTSLISGLSVVNLLEPLVFTERSNTPRKALMRYLQTFHHILLWHYGNVWDPQTKAHKSIVTVRTMHNQTRSDMKLKGYPGVRLSQYDMSLVQCGFMGLIAMYPHSVGIDCNDRERSDYCYFWYGIGYLLGIKDENNICWRDFKETFNICKEIECEILLPALSDPPEMFYPMAMALTDGVNLVFRFKLISVEAFLAFGYRIIGMPYPNLTFLDKMRQLFLVSFVVLVKYVPFCRPLLNKLITFGFDLNSAT